MWIRHSGAVRPCGHQFDHRTRIDAEWNGASVTTGHPAGLGDALACHAGGEELNLTPEVIGRRFPSSSVIVGVP
jgi:hypothetical protein